MMEILLAIVESGVIPLITLLLKALLGVLTIYVVCMTLVHSFFPYGTESLLFWVPSRWVLDWFGLYRSKYPIVSDLVGYDSVLELGCGTGDYSRAVKGKYMGFDLSNDFIRYATVRHGKALRTFHVYDCSDLEYVHSKMDHVLMVDFIHHFDDKTKDNILKDAMRIANKSVILIEPCYPDNPSLINELMSGAENSEHPYYGYSDWVYFINRNNIEPDLFEKLDVNMFHHIIIQIKANSAKFKLSRENEKQK